MGSPRGGAGEAIVPNMETDVAIAERPVTAQVAGRPLDRFRVAATGASLFFGLLLIYLGTANGRMIFGDDRLMYEVTSGIVERGDVAVQATEETGQIARGQDGRFYSKYGPGLSVVALPVYGAGKILYAAGLHRFRATNETNFLAFWTVVLVNATITAGTGLTLWYLLRRLGLALRWAGLAAILFGTATTAWFCALTFMSEPLTGLCLLLALAGVCLADRQEDRWWLLVSGLAAGLLVATRPFNLLVLPIVGAYLLLRFRRDPAALVLWTFPVVGAGLGFAGYNVIRFGSILETGYRSEAQAFSASLLNGAYGLLLSPGKGLAFFSPILLLGVSGLSSWWQRERPLLLGSAAICLVFLVGYSRFVIWWGGGSWGPRFLVPLLPLLMIAVGFGLPVLWRSRLGRAALIGLTSLSVLLQLGGVLVDFGVYWEAMRAWHGGFSEYENPAFVYRQIYDPMYSPLLGHLWLLVTGHRWVVVGTTMNSLPVVAAQIVAFVGGVLLCVAGLWGIWRLDHGTSTAKLVDTGLPH